MAGWLNRRTAFAVGGAQALAALAILRFGQDAPIPVHFGMDGTADRYGDRLEVAALVGSMALLTLLSPLLFSVLGRRRGDPPPETLHYALLVVMLVTTSIICVMAALAFGLVGSGRTPGMAVMAVIGGVMAGAGAWMGKVGPNPLVGLRTPWALTSRLAWDKSNRLAGRLFFWGGLASLLTAPLAPQPIGMQVTVIGVLAAVVASVIESWRVWRTDPERHSGF